MNLSLTQYLHASTMVKSPSEAFVTNALIGSYILLIIITIIFVMILTWLSDAHDDFDNSSTLEESRATYAVFRRLRILRVIAAGALSFVMLVMATLTTITFLQEFFDQTNLASETISVDNESGTFSYIPNPDDPSSVCPPSLDTGLLAWMIILWILFATLLTLTIVFLSLKPGMPYEDSDEALIRKLETDLDQLREEKDTEIKKLQEENDVLAQELSRYDSATTEAEEE